jgi:hypothetical protein
MMIIQWMDKNNDNVNHNDKGNKSKLETNSM